MRGWRALANSAHLGRKRLPLFAEQKIFRACLIKRSFSFPAREQSAFMKAVVQNNAQLDANSLRLADDQPVPTPDPEQVLIKVAYAGVNRPDLMQRRGLYPPPSGHSPVLGLEVSGTVVATGAAVTDWKEGDQVRPRRAKRKSCSAVQRADLRWRGGAAGVRAHARGRLRGVLRGGRGVVSPDPRRAGAARGGRAPGGVLHRVGQRVRARAAAGRRDDPRPRWNQRRRVDGRAARQGARRACVRHVRLRGEVRARARTRRRPRHRLLRPGLPLGAAARAPARPRARRGK